MRDITFQSVFDTPTVKQSNMNSVARTPDGRVWEYLKTTEAVTKHMVVSNPANTAVTTVSSAASTQDSAKYTFITEASAGWTVGAYQDHWCLIISGTGQGQSGKIKDNTADTLELYYDHAFTTALAVADSAVTIRHYTDAEKVAISTEETPVKGVAQVTFASGDYGWFLKRGVGGVLAGEVITINIGLTPGDDTEGYAIKSTTAEGLFDANCFARCLVANGTADYACLAEVNVL